MAVITSYLKVFYLLLALSTNHLTLNTALVNGECRAQSAPQLEDDFNDLYHSQNATSTADVLYAPTQRPIFEKLDDQQRFNPMSLAKRLVRRDCTILHFGTRGNCGTDKCCQLNNNDWCCVQSADCGDLSGNPPAACTFPRTTIVVSATTTAIVYITSTYAASYATATDVTTSYTTVVTVVTQSDLDIATEIRTVTVTAGDDQRKRRAPTVDIPPMTQVTASVDQRTSSASSCQSELRLPHTPQVTGESTTHARLFNLKRQVSTITYSITRTSTSIQSSIVYATRTIYYKAFRTITSTTTSTFTSAVNAKTTVTQVSTYTSRFGNSHSHSDGNRSETMPTGSPSAVPGKSTLSTGAKAGIGVGAASGFLIISIILGIIIRLRRKKRMAETAEMINAAVAAGRNDAFSPISGLEPANTKYMSYARSSTINSPPVPASLGMYAPILVPMRDSTMSNNGWDNSSTGYSPVPQYANPPGNEMSATPVPIPMQYQMQNQYYSSPSTEDIQVNNGHEVYQPYHELPRPKGNQHEMSGY
ncbi:hypothetical protein BKA66DRAFT_587757 [Pyrenochaeta sp. MPI-SDFR-AT-0127]|nr:hypothetical protein BKA66DRAFT_587757 [Pyrenochaeta sp. MPI-SDFR-AT-0127]